MAPKRREGSVFLRTDFGHSTLVKLLGGWAPVEADPSGADFAERLSLWVNAFDAIGLQAAHQSIRAIAGAAPAPARAARPLHALSIEDEVRAVRAALAHAIAQAPEQAADTDAAYAPYRQRHQELQRRMEQMIAPLRDHVRQVLSRVSAGLRQLAALDAVLEQVLAPREQLLLPKASVLLERRFQQLRAAGDGDWLQAFGQDWRQALLAELELRLEPVTGLVEALANETTHHQ
jgi:hypothetical protein